MIREFLTWFFGLFDTGAGEAISSWWGAAILLGLAAVVGLVIWAIIRLQPARRAARSDATGIFDEVGVDAAEYRRRAKVARAAGDFDAVVLDAYRAVAAGAVERFILDDQPGATAREIAVALAQPFAAEGQALREAALSFDAVRYGARPAGASAADAMLDLDRRVSTTSPRLELPA